MDSHPKEEEVEYEGLATQSLGTNMLAGALVSSSIFVRVQEGAFMALSGGLEGCARACQQPRRLLRIVNQTSPLSLRPEYQSMR